MAIYYNLNWRFRNAFEKESMAGNILDNNKLFEEIFLDINIKLNLECVRS